METPRRFVDVFLAESQQVMATLLQQQGERIETLVQQLRQLRERQGRLFIIGVGGGGAGNGSHAQGDFEKLARIDTTCLADNASSVTAYANDEGWETIFVEQLRRKNLNRNDAVFVFSVGGGSDTTSLCIVKALEYTRERGAQVFGIVGKDGGATARLGDTVIVIPPLIPERITAHTESIAVVVWHLIANHPDLAQ